MVHAASVFALVAIIEAVAIGLVIFFAKLRPAIAMVELVMVDI